jgi:protein-ribulosamine 3-kinase
MIPVEISAKVKTLLTKYCGKETDILRSSSIGGGCINNARKLETSSGIFFLKWNDAQRYPKMFEGEAKGLILLKKTNTVGIPDIIGTDEAGSYSFIVLEFIEPGKKIKNFWEDFGTSLAQLHKNTSELFGLEYDNYIGSLPQRNTQKNSWIEFFIEERLEKQIALAKNSSAIDNPTIQQSNNLYKRLSEIIPEEKPSLLHGDLWNGNVMTGADGKAWLMDPAVYYGHREMDIAMSKLFGGFSPEFYESYREAFPLQKGSEERMDIYNLYPLLVHVNLFGGGYLSEVKNILSRF